MGKLSVSIRVLLGLVLVLLVGCATTSGDMAKHADEHCSPVCSDAKVLATQGDVEAEDNLANMYLTGTGVDEDYNKAGKWFTAAANAGNADAEYNVGNLSVDGYGGVFLNYVAAMDWYHKAADQGFAKAYAAIGDLYVMGRGVPQDSKQAMEWYQKGAEHGDTVAMTDLGIMYYQGRYVPQDYAQAKLWFKKAVDAGSPYAEAWLGEMLLYGRGVPQDAAGALQLFAKAADANDLSACLYLAKLYAYGGPGVEVDLKKSQAYFERAADHEMTTFDQMAAEMRAIVDAHKFYPRVALNAHLQDVVTVEFDLEGNQAAHIKVVKHKTRSLDDAAVQAVADSLFPRRAQPLQALEHFIVKVNFSLGVP